MKTAVVGYGNLVRSDDAAGIIAIEKLQEMIGDSDAEFFYGYNAVDLLSEMDSFQRFILIDAAMLGKRAGEYIRVLHGDLRFADDTAFGHGANFKSLVQTAESLGISCPKIVFYLIQPKETGMGETVSAEVQEGLAKMLDEIAKEILC
jgi:hydrogenase maturation protease